MANETAIRLQTPGNAQRSLSRYLESVWSTRRYLWAAAQASKKGAISGTSLGSAWYFLEPLMSIGTYFLIFGVLLDTSRGVGNFLAYLTVGHILFAFSQRSIIGCATSVRGQLTMANSLSLPRLAFPIIAILRQAAIHGYEIAMMLFVLALMGELRVSWLLLPAILAVGLATTAGLGFIAARISVRAPDFSRLLTHLFRLTLYATGVFFPIETFVGNGLIRRLLSLNPFFNIIGAARHALLGMEPTHPVVLYGALVFWCFIAVSVGLVFFQRGEATYGPRTRS